MMLVAAIIDVEDVQASDFRDKLPVDFVFQLERSVEILLCQYPISSAFDGLIHFFEELDVTCEGEMVMDSEDEKWCIIVDIEAIVIDRWGGFARQQIFRKFAGFFYPIFLCQFEHSA